MDRKQIENFHTFHYLIDAGSKTETRENVLYSGVLRSLGSQPGWMDLSAQTSKLFAMLSTSLLHATVEYSTQLQDQDPGAGGESANPLTWIPRWKMDYSIHEWVGLVDAEGTPIANSAGQAFDQGMPDSQFVTSFVFSQYEPDNLTEKEISERNGVVNSKDFKGFKKYTLLLTVTGSERGKYSNGYPARKIDYRVDFKEGVPAQSFRVFKNGNWVRADHTSGWLETRYDVGEYWIEGGNKRVETTAEGYRTEAKLNGQGGLIAADGTPALLAFKRRSKDFYSFLRV